MLAEDADVVDVEGVEDVDADADVGRCCCWFKEDWGGFQCRNAVHILQGFPSGPKTIPGGSGVVFEPVLGGP